jgi:aspartate dehydrogenase
MVPDPSRRDRSLPGATRIGVIGSGAIGEPVIRALKDGRIPGCDLTAVLTRSPLSEDLTTFAARSLDELVQRTDLVVEAAGHAALAELGPSVVEQGRDLLVLSVGALVDEDLFARLTPSKGGRLLISTGAVGGLDTLLAAMLVEPLNSVSLTSTKPSKILVRPWMASELRQQLLAGNENTEAFSGRAREAVTLFPESANVAATLALATVGFDDLHVRIVGVPESAHVEHRVTARGRAGSYEFVFRNRPAATNPKTSAIVPYSVIRALRSLRSGTVIGV